MMNVHFLPRCQRLSFSVLILPFRFLADRQTAADDEEGRVALTATPVADGFQDSGNRIALLDTEIPASSRRTRKKACCMCCGLE
jgi:hypothetical protein